MMRLFSLLPLPAAFRRGRDPIRPPLSSLFSAVFLFVSILRLRRDLRSFVSAVTLLFFLPLLSCRTLSREEPPAPPPSVEEETPAQEEAAEQASQEEGIPEGMQGVEDDRPDRKGRSVRTFFYGRELIRERVVVNGAEVTRITLKGSATIRHQNMILQAPRIVLEGGEVGRLSGGVRIVDRENDLVIQSYRAHYSRSQQKVTLEGMPRLTVRRKNEKPSVATSDRMERDLAEKISYLKGDVRIFHEGLVLLADEGRHEDKKQRFILEHDPVAISPGNYLSGKRMVYDTTSREVIFEEEVVFYSRSGVTPDFQGSDGSVPKLIPLEKFARRGGRFSRNEKEEEKKEGEKAPTILTSDRLVYRNPRREEPEMEITGNVRMTRGESFTLTAPHLISTGKNFQVIRADQGVDMVDREQKIHVVGGLMLYDRQEQKIRLEQEPRMDFLGEGEEVTGSLSGAVIESDRRENLTMARGSVVLTGKDYRATGELATYHEAAGVVVLEGYPGLEKGNSVVHSEKIMIYPDKNRVLLMNRIRGSFQN